MSKDIQNILLGKESSETKGASPASFVPWQE